MAHHKVPDEIAINVRNEVLMGMGFIGLHSAHHSKPFKLLMGTTCNLSWRENGRIFYFQPGHETFPIFYNENVQTIIRNAVYWANPVYRSEELDCPHIKKIDEE